ncbi:MAG: hypothetical protein AAF563_17965 [Pseudomonadota bacterium]
MSQSHIAAATPTPAEVVSFDGAVTRRRSDRELADAALLAAKKLQDAMDDAIKAGLIVEPTVKMVENRFASVGVSSDSYLLNLNVWRKLS